MIFFLCDIFRKLFRTSNSSPGFSLVMISDRSNLNVKFHKFSRIYLICFLLISLLSLGGLTRGLVIILSCLAQNISIKIEQNRSQKLVAGSMLLDDYLSDILRNDHIKCEMPRLNIEPYNQISKASLFMIDKSVIVDFKNLIQQIDWLSTPFISSQRNKDLSTDTQISFLCPTFGSFSSFFGIRTDPVYEGTEKHCGVDIAGPLWSPVIGTADGIVAFAGWSNRYGNLVVVDHGKNGIQTIYAHLQKISVRRDDRIVAGQRIGYMGSTGKSTGPHLHYEVRKNGKPVNPISYLLPHNEVSD
jgi:hypothetical protein